MSQNNLISVVIVTYNSAKSVTNCIKSVIKSDPKAEIIVVDNGSTDQTIDSLRELKNKIKVIESKLNLGFGKGCNLGAKHATGEYLVFLNPDTKILTINSLLDLVTKLQKNPEFGLIGPKFVFPNGKIQSTVRNIPTLFNAFLEYILQRRGSYDFYDPSCTSLCSVQTVVGACMVISKKIFTQVEGFDDKFFLYYEDIDLCQRILNKGLKVGYDPEVVIQHIVGASGKNSSTSGLLRESAIIYHGLGVFYLLQLIFYSSRLIRK